MLVDLTPIESEKERCIDILKSELGISDSEIWKYIQSDPKLHEETGVYWTLLNFGMNFFKETKDRLGFKNEFWHEWLDEDICIGSYGVADNIDQIKEYYKRQIEDPDNKYFIAISPIFQDKDHAGKGGGWRWHKWGPYIGKLNPQYEYLDDEEFGEDFQGYVLVFHCYKL